MTPADTLRHHLTTHYLPHESPTTLRDDTPLITGGILDSIRTLKLLVWIEDTFGVFLPIAGVDEATERLDTIAGIVREIERAKEEVAQG